MEVLQPTSRNMLLKESGASLQAGSKRRPPWVFFLSLAVIMTLPAFRCPLTLSKAGAGDSVSPSP